MFIRREACLAKTWVVAISDITNLPMEVKYNADMILYEPVDFAQMRELSLRLRRAAV